MCLRFFFFLKAGNYSSSKLASAEVMRQLHVLSREFGGPCSPAQSGLKAMVGLHTWLPVLPACRTNWLMHHWCDSCLPYKLVGAALVWPPRLFMRTMPTGSLVTWVHDSSSSACNAICNANKCRVVQWR